MKYIFGTFFAMTVAAILTFLYLRSATQLHIPYESLATLHATPDYPMLRTMRRTNSWFSNVYSFPSQPLFALPAAYKLTDKGLGVSVPAVRGTAKTVFGSYDEMCNIGNGGYTSSAVDGYGDWNVLVRLNSDTEKMSVSLAQGFPYAYLSGAPTMKVACKAGVLRKTDYGVLISRNDSHLLFQSDGDLTVDYTSELDFTLASAIGKYRVIALPDELNATLDQFGKAEWNPILNTSIAYSSAPMIKTTYSFVTATKAPVLTTVWPDMRLGAVSADIEPIRGYKTVMGELMVTRSSEFSVLYPPMNLAETFVPVADPARAVEIQKYIAEDTKSILKEVAPVGVYFKGTWIGGLTTLIQLADVYGMNSERDQLVTRLEKELDSAFKNLEYKDDLHMLVAKNTEFGNEKGNDHHFHYGYYIRASAVLGKIKPAFVEKNKEIVELMIGDIASDTKDSDKFPFLRYFSPYEGHSWADAEGNFGDGVNQESSSEALNAWYAIYLWGKTTSSAHDQNLGSWLFTREFYGTKSYWFGQSNPFPEGYSYPFASLIWGGKRDFATWFSGNPMHIFGIQILPITPASTYLKNLAGGKSLTTSVEGLDPKAYSHEWADLLVAYTSYSDAEYAKRKLPEVKAFAGIRLKSLLYQTVYSK